jgi:hypothetical protein
LHYVVLGTTFFGLGRDLLVRLRLENQSGDLNELASGREPVKTEEYGG